MNEVLSAVPVITSLIIIEGLLSVDNAMAIAAMASGLPENQKRKALRYGIVGAYVMRGVCLLCAAWIASNPWIKAVGAGYLIYLMVSQIRDSGDGHTAGRSVQRGFWMTVAAIELMDLSLSLDNVVAAVALDRRMWVICAGVFIGILILRFVAGFCIRLVEKHPILKTTAFLLVGFVGFLLLIELAIEHTHATLHIPSWVKFAGIFGITAASLLYEHQRQFRWKTNSTP
jgi:tellurite resistance protein TerC